MTNAVNIARLLSLCALVLLFSASSVWALDPSQPMSSYIRTHFSDVDGLPANHVHQIVQSRDGFLWLDVGGNLVRFDGSHFTAIDVFLGVQTLALAPNGDLWLGTTEDLKQIPATALNQFGSLPITSYHPNSIPI